MSLWHSHVEMGFGEMPGANLGLLPGNYRLTILFPFFINRVFPAVGADALGMSLEHFGRDAERRRMGYIFAAGLGLILHPWLGVECRRWLHWGRWDAGPAGGVCVSQRVTVCLSWSPDGPSVCCVPGRALQGAEAGDGSARHPPTPGQAGLPAASPPAPAGLPAALALAPR